MPEDLGDEGVTKGVGTIAPQTFTKERKPQSMSELSHHRPNQPSQQDHAQVILNRLKAKARNCCQKNKQVLGEARAQYNRSSIVKLH